MEIKGKTFCITGILWSYSRSEIKKLIESLGGVLKQNMSKKVDYFCITADCINDNEHKTTKIQKWIDGGTSVLITEMELREMLGEPYDEKEVKILRCKYRKSLRKVPIDGLTI